MVKAYGFFPWASPEGKLDFLAIGTPPLISHFHRFRKAAESDSFPPGEAKNRNRTLVPFTEPRCSHNVRADSIRPYNPGGEAGSIRPYRHGG